MTLRDKIEKLIIGLGLTSTRFADFIGINRAIISHILSGRNKPSLEIIQKIVSKFPELGFNWIADEEELDMNLVAQIAKTIDFNDLFNNYASLRGFNDLGDNAHASEILNSQAIDNKARAKASDKKIERVLIFYSDNTFQQFNSI